MEIKQYLNSLKASGAFGNIRRYQYMPYDMEKALTAVKMIGQQLTPDFVIDEQNRFVYENLIRYVIGDRECKCLDPETKNIIPANHKKGIFLCGPCGSGKSMAMRVMSYYARGKGIIVGMYDAYERKAHKIFIFGRQVRVDQICDQFAETGKIRQYKDERILTIDDLGAEQMETLYMGNRVNLMRQLIEYRGDNIDQITSFTSNLPMLHPQMVERYGDRAVSRLKAMCNYYELKGEDRRK